jgi:hypothetical protein
VSAEFEPVDYLALALESTQKRQRDSEAASRSVQIMGDIHRMGIYDCRAVAFAAAAYDIQQLINQRDGAK